MSCTFQVIGTLRMTFTRDKIWYHFLFLPKFSWDMSLPGVGKSDVTCSSSIVITMKYGEVKAIQFFSKYTIDLYQ